MSAGNFNQPGFGPYSFDHQAAWDRLREEEKRKELDYQSRVAQWAMRRLAGECFDSLEALREAIMRAATEDGYPIDEQRCRAIHFAAVHLWCGLVQSRQRAQRVINDQGHIERVAFAPSAA
jgi:hypothetical protein